MNTNILKSGHEERSSTVYFSKSLTVILCLLLALAVLAVYSQISRHDFITYDDDQYVYENPMVKSGITPTGISWAFFSFYYANWHPLTWLSHMLDCQMFGLKPGAHHLMSLALHLASTLLLFIVLLKMTHRPWRSAIVAAIFGLHPLHVESVVWISERKDVLSALFGMATLYFYVRYTEKATKIRYGLVVLAFAFGLMSKPMLVTFPFVLLLLDFWPLRRIGWPPPWSSLKLLLWEKLPLFILTAVSCVLTFLAQRSYGAVAALIHVPLSERLGNAAVAYVAYIGKTFWPVNLAVLYPSHPHSTATVLGAVLALLCITLAVFLLANRRPYLMTGWLWYLGMCVPVIGIVQVGMQSMADRYSYLPLIGLSIALVWGVGELIEGKRIAQQGIAVLSAVALLGMALVAYRQAGLWKNSFVLFQHTLASTSANYPIHNNMGVILADNGEHAAAVEQYRTSIAINPGYPEAHANLGHELIRAGRLDEALAHLEEALRLKPGLQMVHSDIGVVLAIKGDFMRALPHLETALRVSPGNEGHSNLCYVLQRLGRLDEAVSHCNEALKQNPMHVDARFNLATALAAQGKRNEAIAELSHVLMENPNHGGAREVLQQLQGPKNR